MSKEAVPWSWAAFLGGSIWSVAHGLWWPVLVAAYCLVSIMADVWLEAGYWNLVRANQAVHPLYESLQAARFNLYFLMPAAFLATRVTLGLTGNKKSKQGSVGDVKKKAAHEKKWIIAGILMTLCLIIMAVIGSGLIWILAFVG
jgi:hypothetical protein